MMLAMQTRMNRRPGALALRLAMFSFVAAGLAACEGVKPYHGPDSVIAVARDGGIDSGVLPNGRAAIAYDPDGCQAWIIDDGLEGYSTPRVDPKTGKRICDNKYPPGTVLGDYQSPKAPIRDWVRQ